MTKFFIKTFGLSEKGAKDLVKASNWMAVINILIMLLNALAFWYLKDTVMPTLNGDSIKFKLGLYIGFSIFMFITMVISNYIQYNVTFVSAYEESATKRITLAEALREIPLSFFGKRDIADLTTTIMKDAQTLETVFSHFVPELFGSIISTVLIALSLFLFNVKIALAMFWVVPISFALCILTRKLQNSYAIKSKNIQLGYLDKMQECVENIKDIKANDREEAHFKVVKEKLVAYEKSSVLGELVTGICVVSAQMILKLGIGTTMVVGVYLLLNNEIDVLTFLVFLMVVTRVFEPLVGALMNLAAVYNSLISVDRMRVLENEEVQTGKKEMKNIGYDVEFKDVVFGYNEKETVLDGISFVAKQGEVTALVGPSGGGKSTAIKLAARFWDINKGSINIGGEDISQVHPEELLKNISIVFQDVTLFDNSIMENIRVGRKTATDDEVVEVAKQARCHDFIMELPNGYDTLIGENGSSLSGGERQRLSIARALLKDAPIILLDEATSSLDINNETQVQTAISNLIKNKTVMVIAHRMRTIAGADKIVLLKDGKIMQEGRHGDLIKSHGDYKDMVELQTESINWQLN